MSTLPVTPGPPPIVVASISVFINLVLYGYTCFSVGRLQNLSKVQLTVIMIGSLSCLCNCLTLVLMVVFGSNPYELINVCETICWILMIQIATYMYCERITIFAAPRRVRWVWAIQAIVAAVMAVEGVLYQYEKPALSIFIRASVATTTITASAEIATLVILLRLIIRVLPRSSALRWRLLLAAMVVVSLDAAIWAFGMTGFINAHLFLKPVVYQLRIGTALSFYGVLRDLIGSPHCAGLSADKSLAALTLTKDHQIYGVKQRVADLPPNRSAIFGE
ncbi:hypothetical protein HDU89_000284 [Geranomyces variabilis]|nr:hypothetical protein HDU89_000284 [Geranomyces variabilis]